MSKVLSHQNVTDLVRRAQTDPGSFEPLGGRGSRTNVIGRNAKKQVRYRTVSGSIHDFKLAYSPALLHEIRQNAGLEEGAPFRFHLLLEGDAVVLRVTQERGPDTFAVTQSASVRQGTTTLTWARIKRVMPDHEQGLLDFELRGDTLVLDISPFKRG